MWNQKRTQKEHKRHQSTGINSPYIFLSRPEQPFGETQIRSQSIITFLQQQKQPIRRLLIKVIEDSDSNKNIVITNEL